MLIRTPLALHFKLNMCDVLANVAMVLMSAKSSSWFRRLAAAAAAAFIWFAPLHKDPVDVRTDEGCSHRGEKTGTTRDVYLIVTVCQVKHQLLVNRNCVPAVMWVIRPVHFCLRSHWSSLRGQGQDEAEGRLV